MSAAAVSNDTPTSKPDDETPLPQLRGTLATLRPPACRTTVIVRDAPRREPPYDDEEPYLFLVGPEDQVLPFEAENRSDPMDLLPSPQADLSTYARRLIVGLVECVAGRRSVGQLAGHLGRGAFAGLANDVDSRLTLGRWGRPVGVSSVHVTLPVESVAEVSAVICLENGRYRAMALRLEGGAGHWRCTWLQLA